MKSALAMLILLAAQACADRVPDLPAPVSFCADYQPVRINEEAGRAMVRGGDRGELEKNAANNRHYRAKCVEAPRAPP